jgi:hypothetical protein
MQVSIEIPDEMAQQLTGEGRDPARAALEGVAIEGYRTGALTAGQTRELLGLETRYELDGFLKGHNVMERAYSLADLEEDRKTNAVLKEKRRSIA